MHPHHRPARALIVILILSIFAVARPAVAHSPTDTLTPRIYLPLMVNGSGASAPPPGKTSEQLIEGALAAGEIDWQTALVYRVFAVFGDSRLPARFQGDDRGVRDSDAIAEVQAHYAELSAATQATVDPFLMPPIYEGSWDDLASGSTAQPAAPKVVTKTPPACGKILTTYWDHLDGQHVRIWWKRSRPGDAAAALTYLQAMERTIWPKLTGLMGHEPLPDGFETCNGGDARLDIYIHALAHNYLGLTPAHNVPSCTQTPAFIEIPATSPVGVLAHEFMHTIQFGYKMHSGCLSDYHWLADATATWAEDYVYPDDNTEHETLDWFFVDNSVDPLEMANSQHEYGAYIFFLYLTKSNDQPGLISTIWSNTENMDSIAAVKSAVPGDFEAEWAKFALDNGNVPPLDYYRQWDGIAARAKGLNGPIEVKGPGRWPTFTAVPHLGLLYKDYLFKADNARLVTFINGYSYNVSQEVMNETIGMSQVNDGTKKYSFTPASDAQKRGLRVYGLFKIEGQNDWQWENWTDKPYVSFCRDAKAERLQELLVVISNSEQEVASSKAPPNLPANLEVSDIGCWRYRGTASESLTSQGSGASLSDVQQVPDVIFQRTEVHPDIPYPYLTFRVSAGQWNRDLTISGDCHGHATDEAVLSDNGGNDALYALTGATQGPSLRRYFGYANTDQVLNLEVTCPDGSMTQPYPPQAWFEPSLLDGMLGKIYLVAPGGAIAGDENLTQDPSTPWRYTWDLKPEREP